MRTARISLVGRSQLLVVGTSLTRFTGKWFKQNPDKREHIFLATKFALKYDAATSGMTTDSTPEYCRQACEMSLSRLGVDSVDIYYCHRVDQKTPIEKTVGEMKKLKQEGKIKYLGLSEVSSETLRRACKIEHISAVQIEYVPCLNLHDAQQYSQLTKPPRYSPFSLDIESEQIGLLKTARELGVAIVAYSPIGRGMLGGQIRSPNDFEETDYRRFAPRFTTENFPKNLKLVDRITEIAKKRSCTPSQLTLAWILAQGHDFFPIPGTTSVERVAENGGALNIVLSIEDEAEIRKACQEAEVAGGRYPESFSSSLYADTPSL